MPQKAYGSGANAVPMGKLHPILAAKRQEQSQGHDGGGQRPPLPSMNYGPPAPYMPLPPPAMPMAPQQRPPLPSQPYPETNNGSNSASKRSGEMAGPGDRKKRKRSRWQSEEKKMIIPGMPMCLPTGMSEEQRTAYITHLRIEEISRRLRTGDLGIPENPEDRSPSPEPIYNSDGKRLNTRDFRVRKKLEEERHALVQDAMKANPDYKPPGDYKPPATRIQDKVFIPQDDHPHVNFIGLLIGPRGNTLKKTEKDTNCKIMIRGKGSVKDGKGRKDGQPLPGEDEILHALVTGQSHESVKKCVDLIKKIIKQGVDAPEGENSLKKLQLRELAALNGTLRDEEIVRCRNCGSSEHKHWECPEQPNFTAALTCTKCGSSGHIAMDCTVTEKELTNILSAPPIQDSAKMDSEYMSLMAELGEGPDGGPLPSPQGPRPSHPGPPQQSSGPPPGGPPRPMRMQGPGPMMGNNPPMRPPHGGKGPRMGRHGGHQGGGGGMPPWNSGRPSAPKPLMSSPIPPPPNLNRGPPSQGNHQPWNKPSPGNSGPAPPFGMQGPPQHGPHPGMSGHPPPPGQGHGPPPPGTSPAGQQNSGPPPPPPPGQSAAPPPPWQAQSSPWQAAATAYGFTPPPPGYPAYPAQPPPPPPPPATSTESQAAPPPWAQVLMAASQPPPPPPPN